MVDNNPSSFATMMIATNRNVQGKSDVLEDYTKKVI
jgi:hypothetical protein